MNILGIETSCDETSVAIVRDGHDVLSCVVSSQIKDHAPYGGVVPEIASRGHIRQLPYVLQRALAEAELGWPDVDGIAVTYGPGLASSLLVGLSSAKALALRLEKPLYAINHLEAHLYSIFIGEQAPHPDATCPYVCLLVSGGHTCLARVNTVGDYEILCDTIDDAAGEAFDKGATLLGLPYPGGPTIDRMSREANREAVDFPRSGGRVRNLQGDEITAFSYSGLKTALMYYLKNNPPDETGIELADIAASYQEAIVDALLIRVNEFVEDDETLACVGGVSLNSRLREKLKALAAERNCPLHLAEPLYCTDNAAMIAGLAGANLLSPATPMQGLVEDAAFETDIAPNLPIGG